MFIGGDAALVDQCGCRRIQRRAFLDQVVDLCSHAGPLSMFVRSRSPGNSDHLAVEIVRKLLRLKFSFEHLGRGSGRIVEKRGRKPPIRRSSSVNGIACRRRRNCENRRNIDSNTAWSLT